MKRVLGGLLLVALMTGFAGEAAAADGKAEVVFSYGGRLATANADGTGRMTITRQGEHPDYFFDGGDGSPEFSPDGSEIALIDHNSPFYPGGKNIVIVNRDGSERHTILNLGEDDDFDRPFAEDPSWAPDGKSIYFVEIGQVPTSIKQIAVDGSNLRTVFTEPDSKKDFRLTDIDPSPDGSRLLVGAEGYLDRDGSEIARTWLVDPVSGNSKILEDKASFGDWSPDGSKIVFKSVREKIGERCSHGYCSSSPRVFVMKADGSNARRLMPGKYPRPEIDPSWSPDGTRISFTSNRANGSEVYSVRPDGKCIASITNGSPESYAASWNPAAPGTAAPANCQQKAIPPVIDYPTPDFDEVAGQPRLWLGETYLGNAFGGLYDPNPEYGRSFLDYDFSYYECLAFSFQHCDYGVDVETTRACYALPFRFESYEPTIYKGITRRRGALVYFDGWQGKRGVSGATVFTGGRAIFLGSEGPDDWHNQFPKRRFLRMVDNLRPIWQKEPGRGKLPPAELGPNIVTLLHKVLRLRRHNSFAATAEKAHMSRRTLRNQLRTVRDLKEFGPVKKAKGCITEAES